MRHNSIYGRAVGIVGCGSIGSLYARCLIDSGATVHVFDKDPQRLKVLASKFSHNEAASLKVTSQLGELLERSLDGVIVATPPANHAHVTLEAMKMGHRLLCEKPLADTLVAAEDIRTAADQYASTGGKVFGVCNLRYHPSVIALRENLSMIGTPILVRSRFGHRLAQMRPAGLNIFASVSAAGGGVILDCVHELDYLSWLFGKLEISSRVTGQIGFEVIDAEDWSNATFLSSSKVRVELSVDFLARFKRRGCEVIGSDGSLVWESLGRKPERSTLLFETTDHQEIIFSSDSIDPRVEYTNMLDDFFRDGENMQSVSEGFDVLKLAMLLRKKPSVD